MSNMYKIHDRRLDKDIVWEGKVIVFSEREQASKFINDFRDTFFQDTSPIIRTSGYEEQYTINYNDIPKDELEVERYSNKINELLDDEYLVPVQYAMVGVIRVKADSVEDAVRKVHEAPERYPFPFNPITVEGSMDIVAGSIEDAIQDCKEITDMVKEETQKLKGEQSNDDTRPSS